MMRIPFYAWLLLVWLAAGVDEPGASRTAPPTLSAATPVRVGGQPDSLAEAIEAAHVGALCTLQRFGELFEARVWRSAQQPDRVAAWNAHPDLIRWMGRLPDGQDSTAVRTFRDLLQRMVQRLEQRAVAYQVEAGRLGRCQFIKTRAFVRPKDASPTIYLCPAWFEQSFSHRVSTVIHELVHTFGYDHPRGVDLPLEALALARKHPAEARVSPENFEGLMELYVCLP